MTTTADTDMENVTPTTMSVPEGMLPPELWSRAYLDVPGVLPAAVKIDPVKVAGIFAAASVTVPANHSDAPRPQAIKILDPERYDGSADKLDTFIRQVKIKLQFNANCFSSESQKVAYAFSCLTSMAQRRIAHLLDVELGETTLENFFGALRAQFDDPTRKTKADAKLENLRQANRGFLEFINEWEDTVIHSSWAAIPKDSLVPTLLNKVSREIRESFVYVTPPTTYKEFVEFCYEREVRYKNFRQHTSFSRSHPSRTSTPVSTPQPPRNDSRTPIAAPGGDPMDLDRISQERGPDGRLTFAAKTARMNLGRCFRCNEQGHRAAECPTAPANRIYAGRPPSHLRQGSVHESNENGIAEQGKGQSLE